MANSKIRFSEIHRQSAALASAIRTAIGDLTTELESLNARFKGLTGADAVRVERVGQRGGSRTGGAAQTSAKTSSSASIRSVARGSAGAQQGKKRRVRRTREQLTKMAEEIVAFIKKGGPEGVKGSAVRAQFGDILPSIREFVKTYGGKTLKTKGQKAGMTYHAAE